MVSTNRISPEEEIKELRLRIAQSFRFIKSARLRLAELELDIDEREDRYAEDFDKPIRFMLV